MMIMMRFPTHSTVAAPVAQVPPKLAVLNERIAELARTFLDLPVEEKREFAIEVFRTHELAGPRRKGPNVRAMATWQEGRTLSGWHDVGGLSKYNKFRSGARTARRSGRAGTSARRIAHGQA